MFRDIRNPNLHGRASEDRLHAHLAVVSRKSKARLGIGCTVGLCRSGAAPAGTYPHVNSEPSYQVGIQAGIAQLAGDRSHLHRGAPPLNVISHIKHADIPGEREALARSFELVGVRR